MELSVDLTPFFSEFSRLSALIQKVVPSINENNVCESSVIVDKNAQCDEVYSGIPTVCSSKRLSEAVNDIISSASKCNASTARVMRPLLTRMELLSVLCNVFNMVAAECRAWNTLFVLSQSSGRFLDASYALVNRLLTELLDAEQNAPDSAQLKLKAKDLCNELELHQSLLDATDEATLTGQLPTPHAHLQAVIIHLGRTYLENYMNWCKFMATMELIPLRFSEFFAGKSWAAVCARGYYYWMHLHARCLFGTDGLQSSEIPGGTNDTSAAVPKPPSSVLHAAVIVRMHGRTLVQFMRQCCEQKLAKRRTQLGEANKENVCSTKNGSSLMNQAADSSKTIPWGSCQLTDNELLNLWLGTRVLIRGCQQVAELYTLMGSVREARAYQDELLRIGQRFHICGIAQTALALMAHVELFAQRKWAFELRLRQLNHLLTCQIPLEEIVHGLGHLRNRSSSGKLSDPSPGDDDTDEAAFLHTDRAVSNHNRSDPNQDAEENLTTTDALSAAANPLVAANVHAFASIFPCSPTRTERMGSLTQGCFPTPPQLASLISGRPYTVCTRVLHTPSNEDAPDDLYSLLDRDACAVGCCSIVQCIKRVLNGVHWLWLDEVIRLVRERLIPVAHYLPAVMNRAQVSSKRTASKQDESDATQELLKAFEDLTTSPDVRDRKGSDTNRVVQSPPAHTTSTTSTIPGVTVSDVSVLHTGQTMLPPLQPPNAPLRLTDRRKATGAVSIRCTRASKKDNATGGKSFNKTDSKPRCIQGDLNQVPCTPVVSRRAQSTVVAPSRRVPQREAVREMPLRDADREPETEMILRQLGFEVAPKPKPNRRAQLLHFYVDHDVDDEVPSRKMTNTDRSRSAGSRHVDPVESCPSLVGLPPRPRNLRLASRWEAGQHKSTHPVYDLSPPSRDASELDDQNMRLNQAMVHAQSVTDSLAIQVEAAYQRLSAIPVPNLMRPICHWLGLHWLSKDNQTQTGRYLAQSVGIAATSLYMSILSSRLSEVKQSHSTALPPSKEQLISWANALKRTKECVAPNHPLQHTLAATKSTGESARIRVIQFCLIDELTAGTVSLHSTHLDCPSGHETVPLGLGARNAAYLVVTRYTGLSVTDPSALRAETRVLHGFTATGLKALDNFDELQVESLDSMQIEDRVRYWRTRYKLDSRLEAMVNEMHRDWFTSDDLKWLLGTLDPVHDSKSARSSKSDPIVLILDRRLTYLPWEWILAPGIESDTTRPTFTRSFSLPLILGHLLTTYTVSAAPQSLTNSTTSPTCSFQLFDPRHTFYVLNPEANLSFTQQTFEPIFQSFSSWRGVIRRLPNTEEVHTGFTDHDLFIYLGHGNGSRFLLQTFNQGMSARAVTLVLGCSSGKPRWEGRHEPYSSLFNHLIAGCPFVAGLLWDVTDRDVDRFTLQFLTRWLCTESKSDEIISKRPSLGLCVSDATTACKLKHLVGKSVIIYGLPVEPDPTRLLPTPSCR